MKKIFIMLILSAITTNFIMAQKKIVQTAGRDQLGEFAPKFAEQSYYKKVKCGKK